MLSEFLNDRKKHRILVKKIGIHRIIPEIIVNNFFTA